MSVALTHCHATKLPHTFFQNAGQNIVYVAKAFAQQSHFLSAVAQAASALPVVSVTPTLGTDWNGESAVFFQIVIADGTPRGQLLNLTKSISQAIVQQVRPLEEWGVLPYFEFRTQSEQARIKEPTWACSDVIRR